MSIRRNASISLGLVLGATLFAPAAQAIEVVNRVATGGTWSKTTTHVRGVRSVKTDGYTAYYDRISGKTKDGFSKVVVNKGRENFWTKDVSHYSAKTESKTDLHFQEVGFRTSY